MQILLFLKEATIHIFICFVLPSLKFCVVRTLKHHEKKLFLATNIRISIRFNLSTEVFISAPSNSMKKKRRKTLSARCAGINHPICLDSDNNLIKCEHFNSRSQFLNKRLIKFGENSFSFFFSRVPKQISGKSIFQVLRLGKGKTAIEPANQKFN